MLDNQPESTKVLGITATPRRDADGINMANEVAQRLGYTNREAVSGKHIAMNMSLTNAIRMGLVVNPKLVSCAYSLKTDGSLDKLKGKIDQIEDVQDRNEKLKEYESLRRNVENAEGIPEILQANVKKGRKYIVFLPVVEDLEDEDGNVIGRKKGKEKIADYEKQIAEYFRGSDIIPNFHSMLGEYGDKENSRRLEKFQNSNSEETEFMLVMNKANEGLHLDKLDGMIWLRPMDENSRILYLQQLGRVIYSEDPDKPTEDEDRPVVIDLVNNTLKVNWENEITEQDDIQMLNLILDWSERHNGTLPDINSSNKEETGYATVLKEIQNKYKEYLKNEFEGLNEKQIEEVQEIIRLGSQVDLWQIDLQDRIAKDGESRGRGFTDKNAGPFELTGLLKNFVELEDEVDKSNSKSSVQKFIETLEKLQEIGVNVSKLITTDTIRTLAKKSNISEEKIQEISLNPDEKIGNTKNNIASSYRGKGDYAKPTEEQKRKLLELGINLEIRNVTQEFIETLEKLQIIGVNVSKLGVKDTIKTLAKKSGISEEKLKANGLNPNERIGANKSHIAQRYRGKATGIPPTEEQVQKLLELGISLEKKENATQEFIEELEKLQGIGVDVSQLQFTDRIIDLANRSRIPIEEIQKIKLNPDEKIGNKKSTIARIHRGQVKGKILTEEQVKKLAQLGVNLERVERNATQEFIEKLEQMQGIGIDTSSIQWNDTIRSLAEKSGISQEKIKESGLNPDEKIGNTKNNIASAYRGKGANAKPTEEQVKKLLEFGVSLEKNENITQKLIEDLEKLQEIGVDVSKLTSTDTIKTLAEKSGISEDGIKRLKLNPRKSIGSTKTTVARLYRGDQGRKGDSPTEAQVKRLLELGINLEKVERNSTQELIEDLEKLQEIGVDVSKLTSTDTVRTLAEKSGISEEKIIKANLDLDKKIGSKKTTIVGVFNGRLKGNIPTEEQVNKLLEMGISLEAKRRTSKEIAQASISSLTDIEMSDREDAALKELVEKTKEGGMNLDEQS